MPDRKIGHCCLYEQLGIRNYELGIEAVDRGGCLEIVAGRKGCRD